MCDVSKDLQPREGFEEGLVAFLVIFENNSQAGNPLDNYGTTFGGQQY
jgi:hypothetical protein